MKHIFRSVITLCLLLSFFFLSQYQAIAEATCTLNGKDIPCSELKEGLKNTARDLNNFVTNELKMSESDKKSLFTALITNFVMGIGMLILQLVYTIYHLWMFIDCLIRYGSKRGLLALALLFIPFVCIYYHFAIRNKDLSGPSNTNSNKPSNPENTTLSPRKRGNVDANQELLFK